eukprot:Skav236828  [mRNA]  locus=scaffold1707:103992:109154:- [translate_table: standard]
MSKFKQNDAKQYMIDAGADPRLFGLGFVASVHDVNRERVILKLPCGELRTVVIDLTHSPSEIAARVCQQWMRKLRKAYSQASSIRWIGAQWVESKTWRADASSLVLLQTKLIDSGDLKHYELYAGGMGGWSRGIQYLRSRGFPIKTTGGVEIDPSMSRMWQKNNSEDQERGRHAAKCLTADVTSMDTWDTIAEENPDFISLSSSCRSFSAGGGQRGWESEDGYSLAKTLLLASRYGHKCILFENVATLRTNPQLFEKLTAILKFCGLEIAMMGTYALSGTQPLERTRFLMVLKRVDDDAIPSIAMPDPLASCRVEPRPNLWNRGRWIHMPDELVQECLMTSEVLDMYMSREHMPSQMLATMPVANQDCALEARCIRSNQIISAGTCMAGYSKQHEIMDRSKNKLIYGSLKRLGPRDARFFHAVEIAIAMGITDEIWLHRSNELSTHAVGNAISETHAVIAILQGLSVWKNHFPWIEPFVTSDIVAQHAESCLTASNIRVTWDDQWIHVQKMSQAGASSAIPETIIDDSVSSGSMESEPTQYAGPKRRKIQVLMDADPLAPLLFASDEQQTIAQMIQAEKALHPFASEVQAFSTMGQQLHPDEQIPEEFTMAVQEQIDHGFMNRILITNLDEGISMACLPTDCLAQWTFHDKSLAEFQWHDIHERPISPFMMIGFEQHVWTSMEFHWPRYPCDAEIQVVRVHNKCIQQQMIAFSPGETIESLLFGEQVLVGPSTRIAAIHDRYATDLEPTKPLNEISVIVLHFEDSHNKVRVVICKPGSRKEHWVNRGTRVFEMLTPTQGMLVVRDNGIETPWDFPIFGPITLQMINREEEEDDEVIPATIPFVVTEAPPDSDHMNRTTKTINTGMVVAHTNELIQSQSRKLKPQAPRSADPWETICRFQKLWEFGAAMADDECSFILRKLDKATERQVKGIVIWDHVKSHWHIHPQWTEECLSNCHDKAVVMMLYERHWIAAVIYCDAKKMMYRSDADLPLPVLQMICHATNTEINAFIREPGADPHGWCGWGSIAWIFSQLMLNPPNMDCKDGSNEMEVFASTLGPLKMREYQNKLGTNDCAYRSMLGMRMQFIKHQTVWPTNFDHVGYGNDDMQQNLKLTGKLAAILISHGHTDGESLKVARQLSQTCPKLARGIPSQKDAKSYASLLQLCSEQGISVTATGKNGAAQKLQRFFRAKQMRKGRQHQSIDLSQISFHEGTFGAQGKNVSPQPKWTATTAGLAIANVEDIQPFIDQDKILSHDYNSAIVNQHVQVGPTLTIEPMEVPVMDSQSNHALIRIWLIHFGQKKIQKMPAIGSTVSLDTDETQVIVLQTFQSLVDTQFWKSLQKSPARCILQHFFQHHEPPQIQEIWSRRWMKGGRNSSNDEADSFSMLCRINTDHVELFMKLSGTGADPIFSSIKPNPEKQDGQKYRIIWTSKDIHSALTKLAVVPDHCGLIHKSPHSFGVRVLTSRFESAWKELRGDTPVPAMVECRYRYLLAGAPPGLSGPKLEEWGAGIQWQIRVLKNYGGGRFLVGSSKEVPSNNMEIQSCSVICQPHVDKNPRNESAVVLGKLNLPVKPSRGEDTLLTDDPWAQATGSMRESAKHHAPWARYKPTTSDPNKMSVDATDGTNEVLAAQSTRLTEMETQIKQIQEQMSADQRATNARFAQVDNSIQSVGASLRSTLDDALKQQSETLVATFESLLKLSPRTDVVREKSKDRRSRSPVRGEK